MNRTAIQSRIKDRITVRDTGYSSPCWISDRAKHTNGYTKTGVDGRTWLTHRLSYTAFVAPIPDGLQLDHLCRMRACCNPDHLEPVTCRENLLRGETRTAAEAAATACIHGHPFDEDNTRITVKGKRACRACDRDRARRYRATAPRR